MWKKDYFSLLYNKKEEKYNERNQGIGLILILKAN